MTLVITDGEFWWSWRELNPRPKFLHTIFAITKTVIYVLKQCVSVFWFLSILYVFNALPPKCRQLLPQVHHTAEVDPCFALVCRSLLKDKDL